MLAVGLTSVSSSCDLARASVGDGQALDAMWQLYAAYEPEVVYEDLQLKK